MVACGLVRLSVAGFLAMVSITAAAAPIFYSATDLADVVPGQDRWRYDYQLANETGALLDNVLLVFDSNLYNFDLVADPVFGDLFVDPATFGAPAGWLATAFPEDPLLFEDGALLLHRELEDPSDPFSPPLPIDTIAADDAVGGFFIEFTWTGAAGTAPGSQPFDFFDLSDPFFVPAGSSFTELMAPPPPPPVAVAEPAVGSAIGLFAVFLLSRRLRGGPSAQGRLQAMLIPRDGRE